MREYGAFRTHFKEPQWFYTSINKDCVICEYRVNKKTEIHELTSQLFDPEIVAIDTYQYAKK